MVKQQRRSDRCFLPAAEHSGPQVRFPPPPPPPPAAAAVAPPPDRKWAGPTTGSADGGGTTEEEEGDTGADGEKKKKRARLDGAEASCDQPGSGGGSTDGVMATRAPPPDQQEAAEHSELQAVGSLTVTIQQSSESREFGAADRAAGLHCHVCNLSCRSAQVFHEHMSGAEHVKKLQEITHSICLNTHTLQDRGRRPEPRRWCDTCRTHFSGDIIIHRRTKQHKMCKQLCRPFCPVCRRHFRTPRKFVEHMKSPEHKQQVQLQEAQEEELITVDAVGCFQEEEEEEEEEEAEAAGDEEEEEEDVGEQAADTQQYDPLCSYGSSFVVPVSGFLCRLCNKFFESETTARHTHCRTRTHYLNLQRAQRDGQTTS